MPITLGIYDTFAYLIPGLLYLFGLNELLRSIGWKSINVACWIEPGQAPNLITIIMVLIGAYVVGHILDPIAYCFFGYFYRVRNRQDIKAKALQSLKDRYPSLEIQFEPKDCTMLLSFLRQRNLEMSRTIEKHSADSIMLRNIAFGLLILIIAQFAPFFSTYSWIPLINSAILIVLSCLSISRSYTYREWFFKDIFRASLEYGASLKEVANLTSKNHISSEKSQSNRLKQKQSKKKSN